MKKPAALTSFLGSVLVGLLAYALFSPLPAPADPPANSGTWQKTFDDSFAGQSSLNTNNWLPGWTWDYYPNSPSANGAYVGGTQDYTGYNGDVAGYPASNVTFDANGLVLNSQRASYNAGDGTKNYTSAVVSTDGHFWQKYGYFEARMQVASTPGLDTAFWMFVQNHNYNGQGGTQELDVAEIPSGSNWNGTFLNTGVVSQGNSNIQQNNLGAPVGAAYHTFGVDWEAGSVTWYLDGQLVRSENQYVPQQEMYMMVSNELERDSGSGNWFGNPDTGTYPQSTHVAWVRVWQRTAPPALSGLYYLVSRATNQVADDPGYSTAEPVRLTTYAKKGGANQQWQISQVPAYDGSSSVVYSITNAYSKYVFDADSGGTANGTAVNQYQWYTPNGGQNQEWQFVPVPGASGCYTIFNYHASPNAATTGECLDVDTGSGLLQLWQNLNGSNQQWQLVPAP